MARFTKKKIVSNRVYEDATVEGNEFVERRGVLFGEILDSWSAKVLLRKRKRRLTPKQFLKQVWKLKNN